MFPDFYTFKLCVLTSSVVSSFLTWLILLHCILIFLGEACRLHLLYQPNFILASKRMAPKINIIKSNALVICECQTNCEILRRKTNIQKTKPLLAKTTKPTHYVCNNRRNKSYSIFTNNRHNQICTGQLTILCTRIDYI
jgi:hypothetical protein